MSAKVYVCVCCSVCMVRHESSASKFFKQVTRFVQTVASYGTVNRFVVARQIGMTPRQYDQIHPYLLEAYADVLSYDPSEKSWSYIAKGAINKDIIQEEEIPIENENIQSDKDDIIQEKEVEVVDY